MKRSLLFFLKAAVSLGLLAFFFSRIDFFHFLRSLSSVRLSYLAIALAVYLVGQLISSLRWALLARTLEFQNPWKDFAVYYFIGMFFSLFTPSTVGGDLGRIFYLSRDGAKDKEGDRAGSMAFATISVLADRAVGMAVLVWIGAVAVAVFPGYSLPPAIRYLTFAIALGLLLGFVSLPLFSRLLKNIESPVGKNLRLALEAYWDRWPVIVQTMLLSLIVHILQSWMQVLIGRALEAEIPWSYALIIYPLVGTFSALPVSLNGIGLREGGYLFLLLRIGVSSEKAIAFSLLWFMVIALDSLIGALVFILKKKAAPSALVSEAEDYVRK